MDRLTIGTAPDGAPFALPPDAITQTFAILAKRRVGKTYTASVLAEEMIRANLPFVALDPTGAWWGLRSSADGTRAGFPVVVFGGTHGDVPLDATAGKEIADLIVEYPSWYVLDLSHLESNAEQDRFAADFAARLYRRKLKAPAPLHLFVDEADAFIPQRPLPGQQRMLGAFEALIRRGGIAGIGMTMISQRPAVINKNVLTQAEVLVALQIVGSQDRDAIDDWVRAKGTREQRDELMASLAALGQGEAWIWSPAWLDVFTRVCIRERTTYNSSATPKVGETLRTPQRLADVNLAQIRERLARTIEQAESDDPAALRRRIAALEQQLRERPAAEIRVERVEVPVLDPGQAGELLEATDTLYRLGHELIERAEALADALGAASTQRSSAARPEPDPPALPAPRPATTAAPKASPPAADPQLRGGERRMLSVLARHSAFRTTRAQLGTLSGFTPSGGTFGAYLGTLKRAGYVTEAGGILQITPAGLSALGAEVPRAPQTTEELLAQWRGALRAGERKMLDLLVAAYPAWRTRAWLAEQAGYEQSGGTFGAYLGTLRRNGLIEQQGDQVRASATLFLG